MIKSRSSMLNVTVEEIENEHQLLQDAKSFFPPSVAEDLHLQTKNTEPMPPTITNDNKQDNTMDDNDKNGEEEVCEKTTEATTESKEIEESPVDDMSMEVEERPEIHGEEETVRGEDNDKSFVDNCEQKQNDVTRSDEVLLSFSVMYTTIRVYVLADQKSIIVDRVICLCIL